MRNTFDSAEYAWKDITMAIQGRVLYGATSLKYTEKLDMQYKYAKGGEPYSIQEGNYSYEGELGMTQSEFEALIRSSKHRRITKVKLDHLTISYAPEDGIITTDQIYNVRFPEGTKSLSQGDGSMEVVLPIMFLRVRYNV